MKLLVLTATACSLAVLVACSDKKGPLLVETSPNAPTTVVAEKPADPPPEEVAELPAGAYALDPSHSSLVFRVDHLGFANYTAGFRKFEAKMQLDPADATKATLGATVDANSLQLNTPPAGFEEQIKGKAWLDAKQFPTLTFKSTKLDMVGKRNASVTGDFTMHGVTKPVTLEIKFNGGYPGNVYEPQARIGFSAKGSLKRSEFGIAQGIPAPGTKMGVSDNVDIIIEAEFTGPAWKGAPAAPAPAPAATKP